MKPLKIALCDCEIDFVTAFQSYVNCNESILGQVVGFSSHEKLAVYKGTSFDILLVAANEFKQGINQFPAKQIFLLSDGSIGALEDLPIIFKYQSAEDIMKDIYYYYAEQAQEVHYHRAQGATILTVHSPIGRAGKTTIALGIAKMLAKEGKTLYINAESIGAANGELPSREENSFSDMLYFVKQKHPNLMLKIEGIKGIHADGFDYISPVTNQKDLWDIEDEDWGFMLQQFVQQGNYKWIIFDTSTELVYYLPLLTASHKIVIPALGEEEVLSKLNQWRQQLEHHESGGWLSKGIEVFNMTPSDEAGSLPYDEVLRRKGLSALGGEKDSKFMKALQHLLQSEGFNE